MEAFVLDPANGSPFVRILSFHFQYLNRRMPVQFDRNASAHELSYEVFDCYFLLISLLVKTCWILLHIITISKKHHCDLDTIVSKHLHKTICEKYCFNAIVYGILRCEINPATTSRLVSYEAIRAYLLEA